MKCNHIIEILPLYLLDELTEAQKEKIETHLKDCQSCAEELAALQALFNTLENQPGAKMSPIQKIELENRLLKQSLHKQVNPSRTGYMKKAVLIAASIAIFFIGYTTHKIYIDYGVMYYPLPQEHYNLPENFQPTFSQKTSPQGLMVIAKGKKALAEELK